jgi:formylmethanofuran dehydrogenase subunit E
MDREKKVEVVNICIVNALRIDEDHRMMILEKLIQSVSDENKEKLLRLLHDVGQREQLVCEECKEPMVEPYAERYGKKFCLGCM